MSANDDTRRIRAFGLCFDRRVVFGDAYVHRDPRATQKEAILVRKWAAPDF